jgi:hypothetical protein
VSETTVTRRDRLRICGESLCAEGTVRRYLAGESVTESTRLRIAEAAARLGITIPTPTPRPSQEVAATREC